MSRTVNAIKNAGFGILCKMSNMIFAFIARTAFIHILGTTYLGVNGLFSEILSLLSVAELGFGSAMTFSMYKPVAEGDEKKTIKLLEFYKKIYRIIAMVIAALGFGLIPFLPHIVNGADWLSEVELTIYFIIYLFNTIIGYFVSYKFTYLNALQKNYIHANIDTVTVIISHIIQIIVLIVFKNFLLYLCANSLILLISRVCIVFYLNNKYPILKSKSDISLSKKEKKLIYREVKGLALHQFAGAAVHSTDNILISSMINVGTVGLISNYTMLINTVLSFVAILFNSVTSGFGNLVASSTEENYRKVFKEINFINFWIYGFCCIAFWVMIPPFITIWLGSDKLIDSGSFALIIINCYLQGQCTTYNNARIAKGNFNVDKWWAVIQAIVNLILSIVCAAKFGLIGIYIGTVGSRLIYVFFRPYSTYRFLFGESSWCYYRKLASYFIQFLLAAITTSIVTQKILVNVSVLSFFAAMFTVAIVPNLLFVVFNIRSQEFLLWKERLLNIVRRRL